MSLTNAYLQDAARLQGSPGFAGGGSVRWRSPSNIALVKYWGKRPGQIPENPSLSFTLTRSFTETMIEFSRGLRMIVNPDEHVAPDQEISIADYARKNDWLIVRIDDLPDPGFPSVSAKEYNIRVNKTRRASE